jgi:hypothetical protein
LPMAEVGNPDRSINEDHQALLRRGTLGSLGWLPPSAASRFAASRAIRASNPALTRAVFS